MLPTRSRKARRKRKTTILAYHAFVLEKIDAAILAVARGGAASPMAVVQKPVVCATTRLRLDRFDPRDDAVAGLARSMSSNYKSGSTVLSAPQDCALVHQVLQAGAQRIGEEVQFIGEDSRPPFAFYDDESSCSARERIASCCCS